MSPQRSRHFQHMAMDTKSFCCIRMEMSLYVIGRNPGRLLIHANFLLSLSRRGHA